MRDEYVVVCDDNQDYFCTCLLRQNAGIVCRHLFYILQEFNTKHRYQISWIAKRWFKQKFRLLSDLNFAEGVQQLPQLGAGDYDRYNKAKGRKTKPAIRPGHMAGVFHLQRAIAEASTVPTPTLSAQQEKRQFAMVMGDSKEFANTLKAFPVLAHKYSEFVRELNEATRSSLLVDALCDGNDQLKNPLTSVTRGRKTKKQARLKASSEEKSKRKKKSEDVPTTKVKKSKLEVAATKVKPAMKIKQARKIQPATQAVTQARPATRARRTVLASAVTKAKPVTKGVTDKPEEKPLTRWAKRKMDERMEVEVIVEKFKRQRARK